MEPWVAGIVASVLASLIAGVWKLLNDKIADGQREQKAQIDREVTKLWDQIGRDSNTGMRVHVHDIVNVKGNQQYLHDRITRLETWRNGKP